MECSVKELVWSIRKGGERGQSLKDGGRSEGVVCCLSIDSTSTSRCSELVGNENIKFEGEGSMGQRYSVERGGGRRGIREKATS